LKPADLRRRMSNATHLWNETSSMIRRVLALGLIALVAPRAGAQDPTRARIDSLAARVERAEERVKVLEQQLATEAQSAVKTRSRVGLEFRGRVLVNVFGNTRRTNSTGNPAFVRPDDPGDPHPRGLAMHVRQTSLGFAITASDVFGAKFTGDLDVDFHGGQIPSSGGRTFPLLRMRTARALLNWRRAEVLLGQESPLVAGVSPQTMAALGTPGFAAAGNLWLWLPQARLTVETQGSVKFGIQGAVLAPNTGSPVGSFEVSDFDAAERSARPFFQGRLRAKWGLDDMSAEIGVGGHVGWYATALDTLTRGFVVAVDGIVPITPWLEVRGEAYDGKGARSLGGGAIGQLFGIDATLIRSRGGWGQVNIKPTPVLMVGGGYGVDDPHDTDIPASSRLKNTVGSAHAQWRPAGPLVFGFEYRRTRTTYVPRAFTNDHMNLSFGFEF
jgi:hypothetical protein